jgi:hypothetical protein
VGGVIDLPDSGLHLERTGCVIKYACSRRLDRNLKKNSDPGREFSRIAAPNAVKMLL